MRRPNSPVGFLTLILTLTVPAAAMAQPLLRPPKKRVPIREREPKRTDSTPASTPTRSQPDGRSEIDTNVEFRDGLALQIRLEAVGFSPGLIDGIVGPKTTAAVLAFQAARGLATNGKLDTPTRSALGLNDFEPTRKFTFTQAHIDQVGSFPTDWRAKAEAKSLPFKSTAEVAIFEGHCKRSLLERLNPGVDLDRIKAGTTIVIPNVSDEVPKVSIKTLRVNFADKQIELLDRDGKLAALFHCSIAKAASDRPSGDCQIKTIIKDPEYLFRPESWPEVKGIDENLVIPPGPRNPVGMYWIGLSVPGYGIHGTPEPEMIGKTGSHGCFRLTNWDVERLSKLVWRGMPVEFVDGGAQVASRS